MSNPNENCLVDMACPKCKSYGPFTICAEVMIQVGDDGVRDNQGDYDWGDESYCSCYACDHAASVADFTEEEEEED